MPLAAPPAGSHGPLAPVMTKKLLGVRHVFAIKERDYRYAIALDADMEMTSPHSFVHALLHWSARREVVAAPTSPCPERKTWGAGDKLVVGPSHRDVTTAACAAVHLPHQPYFYWWSSAPIYEKHDFAAFFARYDWTRNHNFDHASYLCYKIEAQGWRLVDTAAVLGAGKCHWPEYFARPVQDAFCQMSLVLWTSSSARDAQTVRLMRIHSDRNRSQGHGPGASSGHKLR